MRASIRSPGSKIRSMASASTQIQSSGPAWKRDIGAGLATRMLLYQLGVWWRGAARKQLTGMPCDQGIRPSRTTALVTRPRRLSSVRTHVRRFRRVRAIHTSPLPSDIPTPSARPLRQPAQIRGRAAPSGLHSRSMARKGAHYGARTDLLKTQCWCERTWGNVTRSDVRRGLTFSCGTTRCRPLRR